MNGKQNTTGIKGQKTFAFVLAAHQPMVCVVGKLKKLNNGKEVRLEMKGKNSPGKEGMLTDADRTDEERIRPGLSPNELLPHLPRLSVGTLPLPYPAPFTHADTHPH